MRQIVTRMRPVLRRMRSDLAFAGPASSSPVFVSPVCQSVRLVVGPAFISLALAGQCIVSPVFGSHVSKDYSRKSRFDKSSKHFFRENPDGTCRVEASLVLLRS